MAERIRVRTIRHIIVGAGNAFSILPVGGNIRLNRRSLEKSDQEILRDDWVTVGHDIRDAMETFSQEDGIDG